MEVSLSVSDRVLVSILVETVVEVRVEGSMSVTVGVLVLEVPGVDSSVRKKGRTKRK